MISWFISSRAAISIRNWSFTGIIRSQRFPLRSLRDRLAKELLDVRGNLLTDGAQVYGLHIGQHPAPLW